MDRKCILPKSASKSNIIQKTRLTKVGADWRGNFCYENKYVNWLHERFDHIRRDKVRIEVDVPPDIEAKLRSSDRPNSEIFTEAFENWRADD